MKSSGTPICAVCCPPPELQQQATRLETTINLMSRSFYDLVLYRGELRCTHLFNYIPVEY